MSKSGFGQIYRKLSSKLLDLVVTPQVLGEIPVASQTAEKQGDGLNKPKVVCYVLQNHSRSNALVIDGETRRLKLAPALDPLTIKDHKEKVSVLFLLHLDENNICAVVKPRTDLRLNDELKLAMDLNKCHVFDIETEKCITVD